MCPLNMVIFHSYVSLPEGKEWKSEEVSLEFFLRKKCTHGCLIAVLASIDMIFPAYISVDIYHINTLTLI